MIPVKARAAQPRRDDALYRRTARHVRTIEQISELHAQTHVRLHDEIQNLRATLIDAVALIDELQAGKGQWTAEDVRRLRHCRELAR